MIRLRLFFRNLLSNWVGMVFRVVISFFLTPFIVLKLGAELYGIWSLTNSLIGYMGLVDLGIRGSVGRYVNFYMARNDQRRLNEVINTSIAFFTIVGLLICAIAILFANSFHVFFKKTPLEALDEVKLILPLLAVSLWLGIIRSVFKNIIISLERFDIINGIAIFVLLLRTSIIFLLLTRNLGLIGLTIAVLISEFSSLIIFIILSFHFYRKLSISPKFVSTERFREMWKYGTVSFITKTANQIVYNTDSILIMYFWGPSMVAVYSIATMIIQYAQLVIEQIGHTFFPSIMKSGSLNDYASLRKIFIWYARLSYYFGALLFMGLIIFGNSFIKLWVGPEFSRAYVVMIILSLSELISHFGLAGGAILFSLDKLAFNLYSSIIEASLNLFLSVMFVILFHMDIVGIAAGTLVSMTLMRCFARSFYSSKKIGLSYAKYLKSVGSRILLLLSMCLIVFSFAADFFGPANDWGRFVFQILSATIVYFFFATPIIFPIKDLAQILQKKGAVPMA